MVSPLVNRQSEELVRMKARELLHAAGIDRPPVNLSDIAKLQGVRKIITAHVQGADAELAPTTDGYVITVDPTASPQRQRFSIAHEIGHTFFHHKRKSFRAAAVGFEPRKTAQIGYRGEERLCDVAATELLMPRRMFLKALGRPGPSLPEIERLANVFDTSILATASRYAELCGRPVQINRWTPTEESLTPWPSIGEDIITVGAVRLGDDGTKNDVSLSIVEAFESNGLVSRVARDEAWFPYRVLVQAKAYGRGDHKYVLSLFQSSKLA